MSLIKPRKRISASEVAEILGCSKKTVYNGGAGTDKLTRIRSGRKYVRFLLSEVLALAEKQEKEAERILEPDRRLAAHVLGNSKRFRFTNECRE